jgi:hypothetical protein
MVLITPILVPKRLWIAEPPALAQMQDFVAGPCLTSCFNRDLFAIAN